MIGKTLYVCDLDGTLLDESIHLSSYTKDILIKLRQKGISVTFATARSLSSANVVTENFFQEVPAIVYNGAFAMVPNTGEKLFSYVFGTKKVHKWKEFFHFHELKPLCYSIIDGQERVSYLRNDINAGTKKYIDSRQGDKRLRPVDCFDALFEGEVYYFTCIATRTQLQSAYEEALTLEEDPVLFQEEIYDKNEYWLEVMPRGATKANAIRRVRDLCGFSRLVVFGDGANDTKMFEVADECYAMENAIPELKKIATGVIGSNVEDGVAKWLKNLLED